MSETYEDLKRQILQNVPDRYKGCVHLIDVLQNYIVEMEQVLKFLGWDVEDERYLNLASAIMKRTPGNPFTIELEWWD